VEKLQDLSLWAAVRLARTSVDDDRGQSMVEYGIMVALLALIAISAVALVGQKLPDLRPAANNLHS
jgi:Flp pilus assembly pilin Flp